MRIKNRLKSFRHKYEMNSKEFATFIGINSDQYSRYENNRRQPTLEIAVRISEKLNVTVNDIFYLTDE